MGYVAGTAALAASSVQAMGAALTGFAAGVDPAVMLGPELMIAAGAVLVGAAVELWWLGTVAVVAWHGGGGRGRGEKATRQRFEAAVG